MKVKLIHAIRKGNKSGKSVAEQAQKQPSKRPKRTELVFILDRSGSMRGLEGDTIGGFNSLLEQQQREPGDATVTTVLFDHELELLHDRTNLREVQPISSREYYVRGTTALLDAIGRTVEQVAAMQRRLPRQERAERVLFAIITDGYENASRMYSLPQVKRLIESYKAEAGWEFLFLGANIDAVATAGQFGIGADRATNFHADPYGTTLNFSAISQAASAVRASAPLTSAWKSKIDEDFARRKPSR